MDRVSGICQRLLAGRSLNRLNRAVLFLLTKKYAPGSDPESDSMELEEWLLFAIATQNYRSPTRSRENAVNENGILRCAEHVRYLRSELNVPAFGEPYSRDSVAIRTECAASFAELAARYVTLSPAKRTQVFADWMHIRDAIAPATVADGCMAVIEVTAADLPHLGRQFEDIIRDHWRGAYYVRVSGTATPTHFGGVAAALRKSRSEIQILLEEDYSPFGMPACSIRKVTFLHNQQDSRRYQLLQDAASMGYRITLTDVIRHHLEAGQLDAVLETTQAADEQAVCTRFCLKTVWRPASSISRWCSDKEVGHHETARSHGRSMGIDSPYPAQTHGEDGSATL